MMGVGLKPETGCPSVRAAKIKQGEILRNKTRRLNSTRREKWTDITNNRSQGMNQVSTRELRITVTDVGSAQDEQKDGGTKGQRGQNSGEGQLSFSSLTFSFFSQSPHAPYP